MFKHFSLELFKTCLLWSLYYRSQTSELFCVVHTKIFRILISLETCENSTVDKHQLVSVNLHRIPQKNCKFAVLELHLGASGTVTHESMKLYSTGNLHVLRATSCTILYFASSDWPIAS